MISLDLSISGGELGRKLAWDEEELAYALLALREERPLGRELGGAVQDYLGDASETAQWLRQLANGIDPEVTE